MWTQIAFFGIHRPDQNKLRRVLEADTLALDHVNTHRRRVQQQVHDMIVQQVHFINVQDAAIGSRQNAGVKVALSLFNGFLNIKCPDDAIFRGAHRQIDDARLALGNWQYFTGRHAITALVAVLIGTTWIAAKTAVGYDFDLRQQRSQRPRRRGFGCATLTTDQYAADAGINSIQNQRTFHALLTNNSGKRVNGSSWHLKTYPQRFHNQLTRL